jgi:hypothetical protein
MSLPLSLRPTGLGMKNDFVVVLNGRDVARTYRIEHTPQGLIRGENLDEEW